MEKTYGRINWENYPSVVTPLNEKNLNKMDSALNEVDNRVLGLDTAKLDKSTANTMVQDVSFDEATGVFTITLLDGTSKTIDTKLEKIATNFRFDNESQKLILTLIDGTEQEVDLSTLISQYEFTDSDTIAFSVDDGKVTGIVKDGSITENKLQPNYLADVKVEVAKAESSANSSYESASIADELTQQAKQYRDEAKQFRDETENITHVGIATTETPGLVKPDGTTIVIDATGTISVPDVTTDYNDLTNKPTINGVELSGNKTTSDLGITASDVGADTSGSASKALEDAKAYTDGKVGETLDTYEEITANTQPGKLAGASGVKEGFEQLNDSLENVPKIQCGTGTINIGTNRPETTFTFDKPFSTIPVVLVTVNNSSIYYETVEISNVTVNGFTVKTYYNVASATSTCNWVAIGT